MNYTLIILKPDALSRELTGEIIKKIINKKLKIEYLEYIIVKKELIIKHYRRKIIEEGDNFEKKIIRSFVGKAAIPIILSSDDDEIIENVRELIGATCPKKASKNSIRGMYGIDSLERAEREKRCLENLVHASDSIQSYKTECLLWFGEKVFEEFS